MTVRRPALGIAFVCLLVAAAPARAQDDIQRQLRDSQLRLQEIREERAELQRAMQELQSRADDAAAELGNIERQVEASANALRELDFQAAAMAATVDEITGELLLTRDRLTERRVVLAHRLRSIYKRGPLHDLRVLLGAESFGDLLNRYKYLRMIATYDRLLVREVEQLATNLAEQEEELTRSLGQLELLRNEQLTEVAQLTALHAQQQRALATIRRREEQTAGRIEQLERDERQLTDLIARLERDRREMERRRAMVGEPEAVNSLSTADLGALPWPVDGRVLYGFGPEQREGGIVLQSNGIGIASAAGAPVRAVQDGEVALAGLVEGYGPSVIVSHGGGYYTLYHYLRSVRVQTGTRVSAGDVIGTVGGEQTPEGPHIEFQVRAPTTDGVPEPVDPLEWLRRQPTR